MSKNPVQTWNYGEGEGFRFRVFPHRPEPHPSVTSILGKWKWGDGGIEEWKKTVGKKASLAVLRAAADKGSTFHDLIEQGLLGNEPEVPEKWQKLYGQTMEWVKGQNLQEVIATEVECYHPEYIFSCRIDAVVRAKDGIVEVWDWKTGDMRTWDKVKKCPGKYDATKFVKAGEQLAANAAAFTANTGIEVGRIRVINPCLKTNKFETQVVYKHIDYLYRGFLLKLEAWKHENFNMLRDGFKRPGDPNVYKWALEDIKKDFYADYLERSK